MIRTTIKIDGVKLSEHDLSSISLHQEISSHHYFEIRLQQNAKPGLLEEYSSKYVGSEVSIGFDNIPDEQIQSKDAKATFKGIITGVGISAADGTSVMMLKGHSQTIKLDNGPKTRSFPDMGVQEIVDTVNTAGLKIKSAPRNAAVKLYSVQYKESDFQYLQRLAATYGDWFYYDGMEVIYGAPPSGAEVELSFGTGALESFEMNVQAIPFGIEIAGYDHENGKFIKEKNEKEGETNSFGISVSKKAKSLFGSPQTSLGGQEAKQPLKDSAKRHSEIATSDMIVVTGTSVNSDVNLGAVVKIMDNAVGDDYGKYRITSITHQIVQGGEYFNEFEAVPEECKAAPLKTSPNPPFCETQVGEVVDHADPDGLGRVSVKLAWHDAFNDKPPFIKVMTPFVGKNHAFKFTPEVGDKVMVGFENNDPDYPYVIGGFYDKESMKDMLQDENKFKGIETLEKSKILFDDDKKKIIFHAEEGFEFTTNNKHSSEFLLDLGDGKITIKAGEIDIDAKNEGIKIDSTGAISIESKQELKAKATNTTLESKAKMDLKGAQTTVEGTAKSEIKGATVNVSGQAMTVVKGGIIKLN